MLFNSATFLVFFLIVYTAYILLRKHLKLQNRLLLVASYVFYGNWDVRFLSLILISTVVDFFVGKRLAGAEDERQRNLLLAISLLCNLSILGFFKYFNFFSDSFADILRLFGIQVDWVTINVLLPVGISFYTFQTMSYTIDIYRRRLEPTDDFLDFALFVAFFPQLVAGPIERAFSLLPQISSPRSITAKQVNAAVFLIVWGYFKKVVIADNLGLIADQIFNGYTHYQGLDVIIGILAFAIQIYGDFSGYSDIARGISKLMGFELMVNFRLPYFALNPRDFWSRWHISLSTWLRDYLYIPLGGNRKGELKTYRNLMLTMLLGGLWHGAAWTYVLWGAYHGFILVVHRWLAQRLKLRWPGGERTRNLVITGQMVLMFTLVCIGWVLFRSTTVEQALYMLSHVGLEPSDQTARLLYNLLFFGLPLLVVQIYQQATRNLLVLTRLRPWILAPMYALLLVFTSIFRIESVEFIYFQF